MAYESTPPHGGRVKTRSASISAPTSGSLETILNPPSSNGTPEIGYQRRRPATRTQSARITGARSVSFDLNFFNNILHFFPSFLHFCVYIFFLSFIRFAVISSLPRFSQTVYMYFAFHFADPLLCFTAFFYLRFSVPFFPFLFINWFCCCSFFRVAPIKYYSIGCKMQ